MSDAIQSALVAAVVALVTGGITGYLTWSQAQRERVKWLVDLKKSIATEMHKARLAEYPKLLNILGRLSSQAPVPLTPDVAHQVAGQVNDWFYSTGGLVADTTTRGAVLKLRQVCVEWTSGPRPGDMKQWRNLVIRLLSRDLDLTGLEDFDPLDTAPLLDRIHKEMESSLS